MKKLGVLAAVTVLLGCASAAFAQGSPSVDAKTTGMAMKGVAAKVDNSALAGKIMDKGQKADFVYTVDWAPLINIGYGAAEEGKMQTGMYPVGGTFPGYVYKDEDKYEADFLISAEDWANIKSKNPSWVKNPIIKKYAFTTRDGKQYFTKKGLDTKDYFQDGKAYVIVILKMDDSMLASEIMEKGRQTDFVYTVDWTSFVAGGQGAGSECAQQPRRYPVHDGTFPGYVYKNEAVNKAYLLMSLEDWDALQNEEPSVWHNPIIKKRAFTMKDAKQYFTKEALYPRYGVVDGRKYVIITVNFNKK